MGKPDFLEPICLSCKNLFQQYPNVLFSFSIFTTITFLKMTNNIWVDEYNEALDILFEDSDFSFIKLDIPKSGWDGEYCQDLLKETTAQPKRPL